MGVKDNLTPDEYNAVVQWMSTASPPLAMTVRIALSGVPYRDRSVQQANVTLVAAGVLTQERADVIFAPY